MRPENADGVPGPMAYVSTRDGAHKHLYVSAADGSGSATALTSNATGDDVAPNWSTHGDAAVPDRIVFQSGGSLSIVDTLTGDLHPLGISGAWPSMRRNGNRLVYADGGGIKIVNPDGSASSSIANTAANDTHPRFSPEGTRIVFLRGSPVGNIYVAPMNGSSPPTQLTSGGTDSDPVSAPDGSQIAFVRGGQLWVMDADGRNATLIPTHDATLGDLAVSDPHVLAGCGPPSSRRKQA